MSAYQSKLIVEAAGGLPFILYQPFEYSSDRLKVTITVPAGFATDMASIPRMLWHILPQLGKYDHAAVIHDFLYRAGGMSRADADAVMLEAMVVSGVHRWLRWLIYAGVRVGGWVPWNRYRQKDTQVKKFWLSLAKYAVKVALYAVEHPGQVSAIVETVKKK